MKKINKKEKINSIDHLTVVLEDMNSKFDLVVENTSGLDKRIEKVSGDLKEFKEETKNNFKAVANAFSEMNDRMDGMQEDMNNMQGTINNMQGDISNMQGTINNMQGDISNMQGAIDNVQGDVTEIKHKLSEKVDLKDFQNLEKRFLKLEKLVFAKLA